MVELFPIKIYKEKIIPTKEQEKNTLQLLNNIFTKCSAGSWTGETGLSTGQISLDLHKNLELSWLFESIFPHLQSYWKSLGYVNSYVYITSSWANYHTSKDISQEHSHNDGAYGNSIISGVYYLKKPPNDGNIIICNPLDYILRLQPYEIMNGIETIGEEVISSQYDFLLFPSWLRHRVPQYKSNEDRIAISFNYGFRMF